MRYKPKPQLPFNLGMKFLDEINDKWTLNGVMSVFHGFQEVYDEKRDDKLGELCRRSEVGRVRRTLSIILRMSSNWTDQK